MRADVLPERQPLEGLHVRAEAIRVVRHETGQQLGDHFLQLALGTWPSQHRGCALERHASAGC
jgi:hypothetical protein